MESQSYVVWSITSYFYVDGDLADKTDGAELVIRSLDAGDHVIRAECSNRKSAEELVKVKGEETTEVHLDATVGKKKKKR